MRVPQKERDEWTEGATLLSEQTGAPANVSAFLRVAAREKLARLREEKAKKKGGGR